MTIQANFPNVQPSLLLDFANAKQLPPQVTFTRATTGTYYDGHTTAMAEQNLLLYSQTFNTAFWTRNAVTVTNNAVTAPDGTNTGNTLTEDNQLNVHYVQPTGGLTAVAGGTYTLTVYAKANSRTWCYLEIYDSGNYQAYFDLSAGTIGTVYAGITASITSVGSGWYRCQVTRTISGTSIAPNFGLASADNTRNYTGDGTSNAYFWGSQFEQRSSATAYTATTTQAITNYIPTLLTAGGGQPRFDHNPTTGESLGLLIEDQRTNILVYSNNSAVSFATDGTTTVYSQPGGTPDGTGQWAYTARTGYCYRTVTTLANGEFVTLSMYVKAATNVTTADFAVYYVNAGSSYGGQLNFSTGVVTPYSGTTIYGAQSVGNGVWRVWVTTPAASGSQLITFNIPTSGAYSWGYQMELNYGSPSSYISTGSASATRAADYAVVNGVNFTNFYSYDKGSVFAKFTFQTVSGRVRGVFSINNVTNQNVIDIRQQSDTGLWYLMTNAGSSQATITNTNTITSNFTTVAALSYQVNSFIGVKNGALIDTDGSCTVPNNVTQFQIGNIDGGGTYPLNGWMSKIAYYPQAFTSAQLQALTS